MLASIIYFLAVTFLGSIYFYILYDVIKENIKWMVWIGRDLHKSKDILDGKVDNKVDILGIREDMDILLKNKNKEDVIESELIDTYSDIIKRIEQGNIGIGDIIKLKEGFEKWYVRDMDIIDVDGHIGQMLKILGDMTMKRKDEGMEEEEDHREEQINMKELINMVNNS